MDRAQTTQQAGGILLVGALISLFVGVPDMLRSWASRSWPTAEGEVIEAEVLYKPSRRSRSRPVTSRATTLTNPADYRVRIRYRYRLDGYVYESDRVNWFIETPMTWDEAHAKVTRYPLGGAIRAAYDPRRPTYSILEPGLNLGSVGVTLFGIALAAAGVWMVTGGSEEWLRRRESSEPPSRFVQHPDYWPDAPIK